MRFILVIRIFKLDNPTNKEENSSWNILCKLPTYHTNWCGSNYEVMSYGLKKYYVLVKNDEILCLDSILFLGIINKKVSLE